MWIFEQFARAGLIGRKIMKKFETLKRLILCALGAFIYAAAVSLFLDPNGIVPGGFTGIAMMISRALPLSTGTVSLILNIPLLAAGLCVFGFGFIATTAWAVALSSLFMNLLVPLGPLTDDVLLSSLAGGALMAIGLEIVLLQGATTGGTDIIVKLLRKYFRSISAGKFFLLTDGLIVLCSMIVFKNIDAGLYAGVCIVVSSTLMDYMLYGRDQAKMLIIISDKQAEISRRLMSELDVGATILNGSGAYSGSDKQVILCVVKKWLLGRALRVVKSVDPQSFSIVSTAVEVFGEGYKAHDGEQI